MADSVITPSQLQTKLLEGLPATFCEVTDDSDGCGAKFTIVVVSSAFIGKPMLQQHRLVHKVIEEERRNIHALTLKTHTPESWVKAQKASSDSSSSSSGGEAAASSST